MQWDIDPVHSTVGFAVKHLMVSTVRGRFGAVRGRIDLDPAHPERASADIVVDASSVDTGTPQRDQHLRSNDFFLAEQHPEIAFRSTGVRVNGDGKFKIDGDVTIRGVTRPLTLDAELSGPFDAGKMGTRLGISATGTIDRTEFGVKWNQSLETGGLLVGEKVKLEIELQGVQKVVAAAA